MPLKRKRRPLPWLPSPPLLSDRAAEAAGEDAASVDQQPAILGEIELGGAHATAAT
jgi:hypothetical protein